MLGKDLPGVKDVAGLTGVAQDTVWRWCREALPCPKVGKHWRVRREALPQAAGFRRLWGRTCAHYAGLAEALTKVDEG